MSSTISLELSVSQLCLASAAFSVSLLLSLDKVQAQLGVSVLLFLAATYGLLIIQEIQSHLRSHTNMFLEIMADILTKSGNIERRLMGLEFSPFECCRQITAAIDGWDQNRDPEYASRQVFQELGRYSRNFLQRTQQRPSAEHLSAMVNFSIGNSTRDAATLQTLTGQVTAGWASQLHGLAQGSYDASMTVAQAVQHGTTETQVEFYAMS